ncbi:MAG: ATP-binding protein [Verrucomicrobiales bacterium]|nr:ATP-binding protein [Verrucomicrobiales bacterium]
MEIPLIIILALIAAYCAWHCHRLKKGLTHIADTLRSDNAISSPEITTASNDPSLSLLKKSLSNLLTQIDLDRKSERRQRRFFENMLNQIEDALFILDEHQEIRFSNQAARLLYPSEQDHHGRQLIEVCLDHRIPDTVSLAISSQNKSIAELRRAAPNSETTDQPTLSEHNYLIEAEALIPKDGFGKGAWLLIRDITRQAQTEQIRQDFVANASHELRTPLSIINGYLEMLDDDADLKLDQAATRHSIRTMRNHCDRITRIVEDMLTISKLESSTDLLTTEAFDVTQSITRAIEQLQAISEKSQASLNVRFPKNAPLIEGDHFYWDQIFFNLIENALKQNPKPGLKVNISVSHHNHQVQIKITDDGIGIPAEDLPNIFQRFYRVEKHHAQTIKGTGLGLSIVKRAIEAHQGTITVASEPGRQTTFTITVPTAPSSP